MSQESDMEQVLSAKIGLEKRETSPGRGVSGEKKRMEERNPSPSSPKKVDLGQLLWSGERETAALRPNNGRTSTHHPAIPLTLPQSPLDPSKLVCDIASITSAKS